ncbi:MAG: GrpB family protein [Pyrinomonadaceae bacterium]|nr:GrpB family protein [Pyrinomonadaceae bacterium]
MIKSELRLMPHDVSWKYDFLAERERIKLSVADSSVIIEQIGSTAIPNVHAKPILDISILCGNNGLNAVADALRKLGYEYRGGFDDERGHFYAVLDKDNMRYC